ncbi:very short patch repair endonuclease [Ancylobacter sp. MQZ15Z-1]|uniref:Very short patch repair endonuclease n=1 Tax=Ancylobacter mangrovi TaxID=2972472 RepID=A0A9X2PI07_9HYPH|nr:very short patch repair endonuclease [Ancylobacter mangrovi]MCS0495587.1 very short patch repair endonuclease [Ancylobacter mangrovi]
MADRITTAQRSKLMGRIRRSDTKPELVIRRMLHGLGYRFRVQLKGVPGRPDLAFTRRRKIIQVHGCFWHFHEGCPSARMPTTRTEFWAAKFARNRERDRRLEEDATEAGWQSLIVWECELKDIGRLQVKLADFLGPARL